MRWADPEPDMDRGRRGSGLCIFVGILEPGEHLMELLSFPEHTPVTNQQAPVRRSPHFPGKKGPFSGPSGSPSFFGQ